MYYILVSILCTREIQTNEADPLLVNRGQCNREGTKQKQTYQLDLWVTVDFWHCHLVDGLYWIFRRRRRNSCKKLI